MTSQRHSPWMFAPFIACVMTLVIAVAIREADRAFPPPLGKARVASVEVVDREGALLRAFSTPDGRWRLRADLEAIDPRFVNMLLAYEDKRFNAHSGVDVLALVRASAQFLWRRQIVSGGSTITMQLARLLEGRSNRTLATKLRQIVRAWQIEARLSKHQILTLYLTLAPYGGNLEGVRAASHAYFGKEPARLSIAEAALLVALPQRPEARRPDRHHKRAVKARLRVLHRLRAAGVIDSIELAQAAARPLPGGRKPMPALAAHLAEVAARQDPRATRLHTTVSRQLQEGFERLARDKVKQLGKRLTLAMVLANAQSGEILARVGSADYFDHKRQGRIDMTRAIRSPGSALKPFIYGLAFDAGKVHPATLIDDTPASFGGYRPGNFDSTYRGMMPVREALQLSRNVPAIRLLNEVGVARFMELGRRSGVTLHLPDENPASLAVGLGGVGITLVDLVQMYVAIARGGTAISLTDTPSARPSTTGTRIMSARSAWYLADILSGIQAPDQRNTLKIAYKTGTSYGYRDAWAVGFDGQYVIGIWTGRADGAPIPGISGRTTAVPILLEAFSRIAGRSVPLPPPPKDVAVIADADLPVALRKFVPHGGLSAATAMTPEPPPSIVFPPNGARIELMAPDGPQPLILKLTGGRAPFRWLANGTPLSKFERRRRKAWTPDSSGFSRLTVIDAAGKTASVTVFVE